MTEREAGSSAGGLSTLKINICMQIADLHRVVLVVFAPDLVRKQHSRKRLAQDNFTTDGRVCLFFLTVAFFFKFKTFRFGFRQIHLSHVIRKVCLLQTLFLNHVLHTRRSSHQKKPQNHRHHHWTPSPCRHWWINVNALPGNPTIDTQEHISIFPILNIVNVRLNACVIVEGCDIFPLRTVIFFPPADAVIIWACICYDLCMKADVTQRSLYPPPDGKQLLENGRYAA